jgi:hypothetical protein
MNKKYIVIGGIKESSQEAIQEVNDFRSGILLHIDKEREFINRSKSAEKIDIKPLPGCYIVSVDTKEKDTHTFEGGLKIHLERGYNNLDVKHTIQVKGTVVSGENIPIGALVLFHPNAIHDTYKLNNTSSLSGESEVSSVSLYAIPEGQIFLWKTDATYWQPTKNFFLAYRVFEPYKGLIQNIEPKKIKDVLYVLTGEYAGKIVGTLKACDYEVIFNDTDGRERTVIRARHFENELHDREEIMTIRRDLTKRYDSGELLIGINASSAKKK